MKEITRTPQIQVGDHITLSDEKEGKVRLKTVSCIITDIFDAEGYTRKVKPSEIISLRRGKDYFRVSIK
jgi:hypothetical protein